MGRSRLLALIVFSLFCKMINYQTIISSGLQYNSVDPYCDVLETKINCGGNGNLTAEITQQAGTYDRYTEATIGYGIVAIEKAAFQRCLSLEVVSLPTGLLYVDRQAFANCPKLRNITFPSTCLSIHQQALNGCASLTHIWMSDQTGTYKDEDGVLWKYDGDVKGIYMVGAGRSAGETFTVPAMFTKIWGQCFRWSRASSIVIHDEVTSVGASAFYSAYITSLTIGAKVSSFREDALSGVTSLKTVTVASGNKYFFGGNTFGKYKSATSTDQVAIYWVNPSMTKLEIPDTVSSVGTTALQACPLLREIKFAGTTARTGTHYRISGNWQILVERGEGDAYPKAVGCVGGAVTVTIASTISELGTQLFENCNSLENVTLHSGVTKFGGGVFKYCNSLRLIDFRGCTMHDENGNDIWPSMLVCGCPKLDTILDWPTGTYMVENQGIAACGFTELDLPENIYETGMSACSGNLNLTTVVIPKNMERIGPQAFSSNPLLTEVTFVADSKLTNLSALAFAHCDSLRTIVLPDTITILTPSCFAGDMSLMTITFKANTGMFISDGIAVYKRGTDTLYDTFVVCPAGRSEMVIQRETRVIGSQSFYSCPNLINVVMSDRIKIVERSAFFECNSIEFVRLTANVTYIGARAFESCAKLSKILYCSNRADVDWTEGDPFPTNPGIYLFYDFPSGTKFCGHDVFPILDHHCNIPTEYFTAHKDANSYNLFKAFRGIVVPSVMVLAI